jgi:DNA-binding NarL/FixJ family response regulator
MSPRELQIAKLICQGFRNDDIAENLHITLGTVKTHIRNIYRRVQVESKIAMLLRFVADARELFAQYDETYLVPAVDLAKPARIIPAS